MGETDFLSEISKFTDIGQVVTVSEITVCLVTAFLLSVAVC
ncbi:MAG: hypothetical protein R3A13_06715 [Bdellovibrionota bacterium]